MDSRSAKFLDSNTLEVTIRISITDSLLKTEENLQDALNEAGVLGGYSIFAGQKSL